MPLTDSAHEGKHVEISDTRLFVVERGVEGHPLIVLHGGPGLDHWVFADYLDGLAPDVRVILADQRAHGMSDRPPPETWTIERMARDVVELAEALELEQWSLLGHSFGGMVALQTAVDFPAAPVSLVLSNTIPSLRWIEQTHARIDTLEPAEIRERVRWGWDNESGDPETMVRALEAQAPFHFADLHDERIGEYLRRTAPQVLNPEPNAALLGEGGGLADWDLEGRLGEIHARALVLSGRHERTCAFEASQLMAERIPGAELVVFERSAHMPFVEEQDAYLDAVREFVLR